MLVEYLVEVCLTCCLSFQLPFIFITIYGVVLLNWPISLQVTERIYLWFMLFSSSNRKYPPFPLLSYFFPWLCAWDVCYIIFWHVLHIRSGKKREFVFIIFVQFMMSANSRIRFGLQILFVCLYSTPSPYHHCANLSEGIELIKCLSDIFCRVCE